MSENIITSAESRRSFFARGVVIAAGVAAFGLLSDGEANAAIPTAIPGSGDIQVLNYALQLEDLEADLYAQALLRLQGGGTTTKTAASVGAIAGLGLPDNDPIVTYIKKFAPVEAAHRDFLKSALGPQAITATNPKKYDFGITNGNNGGPLDAIGVLNLVLEAEATGVQAYLGAIPCFSARSQYLPVAAAIQGTEARHTSILTIVRNALVVAGTDTKDMIAPVAPLVGDSGTAPVAGNYDKNRPSNGNTSGIDLPMMPQEVLNRVSGFIKTS